MTKIKMAALAAVIVLVSSTLLTACQTALSTQQVQETMSAIVNETITAMPSPTQAPTATPTKTPSPTPTTAPIKVGPSNFPDNVDPLTGLTVADPSILNRRPVMIKVSNQPPSGRPHAGLSKADIVFDYSTGEGGNRFLALYYGQDADMVGPIRSGRFVDRWLVSMYQGVLGMMYAYAPEYEKIINQLGFSRVINGTGNTCPAICDLNIGISEINWFANTAEMTKYYDKSASALTTKPTLDGMAFNSVPPAGGTTGSELTMHFGFANEGQWKYDAASKKYLAWIDNRIDQETYNMIPWLDRTTNQQLAISNVIVMFASYTTLNGDDTMHEISLVGTSGKALFFRDGQVYTGKWKGVDTTGPIQFFDTNNQPFELQPGNSWISITGESSSVTQDTPGVYKVTFLKP